jgi:hypothetical protein
MLNVITLNVIMLNVFMLCHYAECHYAKCCYADGRGTIQPSFPFLILLPMVISKSFYPYQFSNFLKKASENDHQSVTGGGIRSTSYYKEKLESRINPSLSLKSFW